VKINRATSTGIKTTTPVICPETITIDTAVQSANNSSSEPVTYELTSFVEHRGCHQENGHYVTFVKWFDEWIEYNDAQSIEPLHPKVDLSNTAI